MRTVLSIVFGISVWALLTWAAKQQPDTVTFSTEFWIAFSKVVGSSVHWLFLAIVPWFLVGLTASRHQIICGGIAAAISSLIKSVEMLGILSPDYFPTLVATSAGLAVVQFCYGAAGAALGFVLGGANNSFKPNPHQGGA